MNSQVRIGVIIDQTLIRLWEYRIIKKIVSSEHAVLNLILKTGLKSNRPELNSHSFIIRLHDRIDKLIFRHKFDYDKTADISSLLKDQLIMDFSKTNGDSQINDEFEKRTDLIINLSSIPSEELSLPVPIYGIWSIHVDRIETIIQLLAEDLKVVKNAYGSVGATLKMHNFKGDEETIYRVNSSLYPSSLNITLDQLYGLIPLAVSRIIKEISKKGFICIEELKKKVVNETVTGYTMSPSQRKGFGAAMNSYYIIKKYFLKKVIYLNPDPWSLFFDMNNNLNHIEKRIDLYKEMKGSKGCFWADPFVVYRNGRCYIFMEEFSYKTSKGHIIVIELNDEGNIVEYKKVMEQPYHLSYPFIFEINSVYHMIPETYQDRTIKLFRCTRFPDQWEFVKNLMENISAVDPTLLYDQGKWWLFVSVDQTEIKTDCFNELYLFYTDDLFSGQWQSHPMNPIKNDPHNSRSAGRIYTRNGEIFRPSQDCFWRYGNALNINKITKLNTEEYEEIVVSKIRPTFNNRYIGVHTFNFDQKVTAFDVVSSGRRISLNQFGKRHKVPELVYYRKSNHNNIKDKIRILFFIDGLTSGGKERRLLELMKELKLRSDFEFELVLMNEAVHYKVVFDLGIKIHYLIRKSKKDLSIFLKLYKLCRVYRPDIVHCWDSMTAVYSAPICKLLRIKLINGMVVDTPVQCNIQNKNWLRARITFPFSNLVIGNSNAGLMAYKAPPGRSICIYNGMDLKRFVNLLDPDQIRKDLFKSSAPNVFVVGMVAAFEDRKDYRTLIKAATVLIPRMEDIRFVLVGGGSNLEAMKNEVPPDMKDKIIFAGKRSDIESIVNIFDLGVLLTNTRVHGEGISNSIIEYMALKKAVVATKGGGTDELIIDGCTGFAIENGSVDQLIEKITFFYHNREALKEIGNNGRKMVENVFDVGIMSQRYVDEYKGILPSKRISKFQTAIYLCALVLENI